MSFYVSLNYLLESFNVCVRILPSLMFYNYKKISIIIKNILSVINTD